MNRFLTSLTSLILISISVSAQDIITKKDGTDIEAKILEVSSNDVKFKRMSNLNGPTYTLSATEILMIRYENGEKEIFGNNSNVSYSAPYVNKPNLSYKELATIYNYADYTSSFGDKYSVGWCGAASFLIPGLGQAICNEWGRAAGFFFGNIALTSAGSVFVARSYIDRYPVWKYDIAGAVICYVAAAGLDIWTIIDATRIAKVKNLYFRDNQSASLNISIEPTFAYSPINANSFQPTAGVSLKVRF